MLMFSYSMKNLTLLNYYVLGVMQKAAYMDIIYTWRLKTSGLICVAAACTFGVAHMLNNLIKDPDSFFNYRQ